jgi:hypothetical protein
MLRWQNVYPMAESTIGATVIDTLTAYFAAGSSSNEDGEGL